jgi:hypothetical protein
VGIRSSGSSANWRAIIDAWLGIPGIHRNQGDSEHTICCGDGVAYVTANTRRIADMRLIWPLSCELMKLAMKLATKSLMTVVAAVVRRIGVGLDQNLFSWL